MVNMNFAMSFYNYAVLSTAVTFGVILNAYTLRHQFYSTVIHLVKSKFSVVVLGNMAFVLVFLFGKLTNQIFFGTLRAAERDLLWENSGYAITETCLALTIFREEISMNVMVLFTALLFSKIFHWLCGARLEHMEQNEQESITYLQHVRMISLVFILIFVDITAASVSGYIVYEEGISVQLLFGFEYVLLLLNIIQIMFRYVLTLIDNFYTRRHNMALSQQHLPVVEGNSNNNVHPSNDAQNQGNQAAPNAAAIGAVEVPARWYNKSLYELYLKLVMDILRLIVYTIFFGIIFTWYGIPIHLIRQLYLSFKSVNDRIRHFILFQKVTRNLNNRFANATEQDLENTDRICIICREEMHASTGLGAPKKLNCGHIFHFYCLRNWFERQLKCPTCRADVVAAASGGRNNGANNVRNNVNNDDANAVANRNQPNNNVADVPRTVNAQERGDNINNNNARAIAERLRTMRLRALHRAVQDRFQQDQALSQTFGRSLAGNATQSLNPNPSTNSGATHRTLVSSGANNAATDPQPVQNRGDISSRIRERGVANMEQINRLLNMTALSRQRVGANTFNTEDIPPPRQHRNPESEPNAALDIDGNLNINLDDVTVGIGEGVAIGQNTFVNATGAASTANSNHANVSFMPPSTTTNNQTPGRPNLADFDFSAYGDIGIGNNTRVPTETNGFALMSVNEYLHSQIDLLTLQLQIYAAQITAANAVKEAAMAVRTHVATQAQQAQAQQNRAAAATEGVTEAATANQSLETTEANTNNANDGTYENPKYDP